MFNLDKLMDSFFPNHSSIDFYRKSKRAEANEIIKNNLEGLSDLIIVGHSNRIRLVTSLDFTPD